MALRRVLALVGILVLGWAVFGGDQDARADNAPSEPTSMAAAASAPATAPPLASTTSLTATGAPTAAASLAAATRILDHARAAAATDCQTPADVLVHVLCERRLRVGLRTYYPGFSVRDEHGAFSGYEPDIGRRVAAFLGVAFDPVAVDPKSRIPMLAEGQIDLDIATMGHTLQRGAEVRFIRPHYYISQTAVVGSKSNPIADWMALSGHTVCLPVGSNSNLDFIRHHVRIMTFDRPEQLLDALRFDQCTFIVQDDTFFADTLADPAWSARYDIKFRFAPLPWGMAVARENTGQFAALLDDLSIAFHADGTFLDLAQAHHLDLSYLRSERAKWSGAGCITPDGGPKEGCLGPPVNITEPTDNSAIAPYATWLERRMAGWFGLQVDLSLFRNETTFGLLLEGISYTLVLIVGTQISTAVFALGFSRLMQSHVPAIRRGVGTLTAVGQVTPLPLLMFFVYVIAGGILHYSGTVALIAAVVAIGVYNGSNAARAIDEAHRTLLRRDTAPGGSAANGITEFGVVEGGVTQGGITQGGVAQCGGAKAGGVALDGENSGGPALGARGTFRRAISLASVQLVAFLINAAKGSPAAGMIGVPDFLNVVTDLTASSTDRVTVYLVLLVFYASMVLMVILLLSALRTRLVPNAGRL